MGPKSAVVNKGRGRDPGVFTGDGLLATFRTHLSPALAKFGRRRNHQILPKCCLQSVSSPLTPSSTKCALEQLSHRHERNGQNMPLQMGTIDLRECMAFQQVRNNIRIENPGGHLLFPSSPSFTDLR